MLEKSTIITRTLHFLIFSKYCSTTTSSIASKFRFVCGLDNVECSSRDNFQEIVFGEDAPRGTVYCDNPFTTGTQYFEVFMKNKARKTAVGFLSNNNTTEYMRDKPIGQKFLSMGGAGLIHPLEISAGKYTQGDMVKAEINFQEMLVKFYVNGNFCGDAPWEGGPQAYPAVSSDGGPNTLEVTFSDDA
ncbi:unnamed protein product [Owenia fusiformis]|uniref:Uncharacterized protein n=1 Tax=Owenia fusiformis TaxID=6347 RepID=A0A8J1U8R7_OWEFU|nr:unnamed protein product [Owenia fusiformis]